MVFLRLGCAEERASPLSDTVRPHRFAGSRPQSGVDFLDTSRMLALVDSIERD